MELHLVIVLVGAIADGLDNCVDEKSRKSAILGVWHLIIRIEAVVFAIAVKELVGEQLLDAVEQILRQPGNLGLEPHLEHVEVLVCAQFFIVFLFHNAFYRRKNKESASRKQYRGLQINKNLKLVEVAGDLLTKRRVT